MQFITTVVAAAAVAQTAYAVALPAHGKEIFARGGNGIITGTVVGSTNVEVEQKAFEYNDRRIPNTCGLPNTFNPCTKTIQDLYVDVQAEIQEIDVIRTELDVHIDLPTLHGLGERIKEKLHHFGHKVKYEFKHLGHKIHHWEQREKAHLHFLFEEIKYCVRHDLEVAHDAIVGFLLEVKADYEYAIMALYNSTDLAIMRLLASLQAHISTMIKLLDSSLEVRVSISERIQKEELISYEQATTVVQTTEQWQ